MHTAVIFNHEKSRAQKSHDTLHLKTMPPPPPHNLQKSAIHADLLAEGLCIVLHPHVGPGQLLDLPLPLQAAVLGHKVRSQCLPHHLQSNG